MRPAIRNITVTRGDTYQHLVAFTDAAGNPVPVSANSYAAQLRANPEDPTVLVAMAVDMTGAAAGSVWLTIDAAVTAELVPGRRAWDLEETDGAGHVHTLMGGKADVMADVTRAGVGL